MRLAVGNDNNNAADRAEQLMGEFLRAIKANYARGPRARQRVNEALTALACTSAVIIAGTGEGAREAAELFADTLAAQLHEIGKAQAQ